ncbi:MAG: glucosyl transferase [Ignavibacteriales bacterium]|nr:MAG: glucosyl transferase [Ignavibacteriales bacterium]
MNSLTKEQYLKFVRIFFNILVLAALSLIALTATSCSEPASPYGQTEITLEALDASCTEVWLELKFNNLTQPAKVAIQKDGKDYHRILSLNRDTLLVFEDLEPSANYSFRAIIRYEGKDDKISNTVQVRTMDTTSHSFTWQTFTFGEHSSSTLYDVAIIDENNIWAVGEIYMKDSLGNPDPNAYNAVHWDGTNWELKKIYTGSSCNPVDYSPLKAIFAFSDSNIAITSGGSIGWFNGKINRADCGIRPLLSGSINKMWGSSSSDLYVVGNGGNIANYNGTGWRKIESGTTLNINDIWGDFNKTTQEWEILAVGGNILHGWQQDRAILEIKNGNQAIQLNSDGANWPLSGVWFKAIPKHYVIGSGIYYKQKLDDSVWNSNLTSITTYHTNKIRGNDLNDVIIVGAYGEVLHFNGMRWQSYINQTGLFNGSYYSVTIKNDLVVTVGTHMSKAIITVGKR